MKSMLIASVLLIGMAGAAAAAGPVELSNSQLDAVTAGALALPGGPNGSPHFGPIPVPPPTGFSPASPPVINPGGPILISCTVGVGCIARHY